MSIDTHTAPRAPRGLAGLIVADTAIGDVRGQEGFFHYRQYDATQVARHRTFEDAWHLVLRGSLPETQHEVDQWHDTIRAAAHIPAAVRDSLLATMQASSSGAPLADLRTALSALGALTHDRPLWDLAAAQREAAALHVAASVPWLVAACHAIARGEQPRDPRPELGYVGNYLWLVTGQDPRPDQVRALSRYLILTIDHGFNNSTFTARTVASTGADLTACVVAALGSLSGPLHGGAPSRALDALDAIGTIDRAGDWARAQLAAGDRVMGFGHAIYRGLDPRSELLRETAAELGGDTAQLAIAAEQEVVAVLDEAKPGRMLRANVEYYAGVVMDACGLDRVLFTPTFAVSRVVGWTAHILEQAADTKIIRPASRYVGPAAPVPVPPT
ncbi:citrate synthase [Branchiibius hedensis]|uniref:Citrate synthase n=1 Tax=Branchiibius hedensis TaxID=672460 RepID=A0A2Y8ZQ90_9MICO|nr:citrate/2-methylcitrate synthase [Branchiibius hedensis]PWJ24641.1 citrate synthase [Branchiibius hedensis]SSA33458.1 citrate synthase [Branchiibius hedensis]